MPGDVDTRLLDDYQRDFPLVRRPFAAIGAALGISEEEVLTRLRALREAGQISRVGATVRPNTAGASTLAALAVPEARIEDVAAMVSAEPGVNHSYLREDDWNIWFVATAPDGQALAECLARIGAATGLRVLSLPLVRAFNIDLGFSLTGPRHHMTPEAPPDLTVLRGGDRPLLQALCNGLPLAARPFKIVARALGGDEDALIARVDALARARILTRVGVILKHRALGWTANAMVVWAVPQDRIEAAGLALTGLPGVTLCYQRETVPGVWEYPLFCMIHARARDEANAVLDTARALPPLQGVAHKVLFSKRCFKQRGAMIVGAAA